MNAAGLPLVDDPEAREISRRTYNWDRLRGACQGVLEASWNTFALLVAIRVFEAEISLKPWIQASTGAGLMLAMFGAGWFRSLSWRAGTLLAVIWVFVSLCLAGTIAAQSAVVFIGLIALAQIILGQGVPLVTHIYSSNYGPGERGAKFSTTVLISAFAAIVFGYLGGRVLDIDPGHFRWVFGVALIASLLVALAFHRMPTGEMRSVKTGTTWQNLSVIREDPLFRRMLIAWMILGLGNLMLTPIRTEYLANASFGINASYEQIGLILIGVVSIFPLLSTKVWGLLFDRINLITMRLILNATFLLSIAIFFNTRELWLIAVGAALLGTGFGGGSIMWTLWVTKIASPERAYVYMNVHGFMTGVRMLIAPFLGYSLLALGGPALAAWVALLLIAVSSLIFLPLRGALEAQNAAGAGITSSRK